MTYICVLQRILVCARLIHQLQKVLESWPATASLLLVTAISIPNWPVFFRSSCSPVVPDDDLVRSSWCFPSSVSGVSVFWRGRWSFFEFSALRFDVAFLPEPPSFRSAFFGHLAWVVGGSTRFFGDALPLSLLFLLSLLLLSFLLQGLFSRGLLLLEFYRIALCVVFFLWLLACFAFRVCFCSIVLVCSWVIVVFFILLVCSFILFVSCALVFFLLTSLGVVFVSFFFVVLCVFLCVWSLVLLLCFCFGLAAFPLSCLLLSLSVVLIFFSFGDLAASVCSRLLPFAFSFL